MQSRQYIARLESTQCGKVLAQEREAMKAWHKCVQIVQFSNEDGELRMTRWIPRETQRLIGTSHAAQPQIPPPDSNTG